MGYRLQIGLGVLFIIISVSLIAVSYFLLNTLLLIFSVFLLLVSIVGLFLSLTFDMFRRDKQLDIEALKKQGLSIVVCENCHRQNVLEDQFCIFCGEKLGDQHE